MGKSSEPGESKARFEFLRGTNEDEGTTERVKDLALPFREGERERGDLYYDAEKAFFENRKLTGGRAGDFEVVKRCS